MRVGPHDTIRHQKRLLAFSLSLPSEDISRRQVSVNQEESPRQKPKWLPPGSQNGGKVIFGCLGHQAYGIIITGFFFFFNGSPSRLIHLYNLFYPDNNPKRAVETRSLKIPISLTLRLLRPQWMAGWQSGEDEGRDGLENLLLLPPGFHCIASVIPGAIPWWSATGENPAQTALVQGVEKEGRALRELYKIFSVGVLCLQEYGHKNGAEGTLGSLRLCNNIKLQLDHLQYEMIRQRKQFKKDLF